MYLSHLFCRPSARASASTRSIMSSIRGGASDLSLDDEDSVDETRSNENTDA